MVTLFCACALVQSLELSPAPSNLSAYYAALEANHLGPFHQTTERGSRHLEPTILFLHAYRSRASHGKTPSFPYAAARNQRHDHVPGHTPQEDFLAIPRLSFPTSPIEQDPT